MGGTTAKLAMVEDGEPLIAYQFEASRAKRFADGSGLPVNISTIELIEIGAGGGSIAGDRRAGPAQGRAAQRGRRAGAGVLRARRRACDGDRRESRARLSRRGDLRGRHDDDRPRAGGGRDRGRSPPESKLSVAETRVGHPLGRQREHGGRGARARRRARTPRAASSRCSRPAAAVRCTPARWRSVSASGA